MKLITLTGIAASIFTGIAMVPQLIKLIRKKEAGDISIIMLLILITGLACWTGYGFLKRDWILVISNGFSMMVNIIIAFFTVKYKK
jgi:MtN3 and saliva related transmembrane protein